jgi:thioredoxin 1
MDARAPAREVFRDRALGSPGLEQFNLGAAEGQGDDARTIRLLRLPGAEAEDVPVERKGVLNAFNGDADVGDDGAIGLGHQVPGVWVGAASRAVVKVTRKDQGRMASANVVNVTDTNFTAEIEQAPGLALVDFWAVWCGPCKFIAPVIEQLAEQFAGKVKVAKLDTDSNQNTAVRFNVRSIPTVMFFKDGKHVDTVIGADPRIKSILEGKIQQHLS